MNTQILQMLEHSSDAYVIFLTKTKEVVYLNELAKDHFIVTEERSNKDFFEKIEAQFQRRELALFPNTPMKSAQGSVVYCDIEGGYLDDEKALIWARVTPVEANLDRKRLMSNKHSDIIYLEAIPRLYSDILFRLDPYTKVCTHPGDLVLQFGLPRVMENFPECLAEANSIHPDHFDDYMHYAYGLLEGIVGNHVTLIKLLDNSYEWFSIDTTVVHGFNGEILEVLGKLTNIQDHKMLEEVANYDKQTKTLNKSSFEELVGMSLNEEDSAFIFVNIDNFNAVNDVYNHQFGDEFLAEIGNRLKKCVRSTDYVGRLGGDEFLIYLKNLSDPAELERKIRQLLNIVSKPFTFEKKSHTCTASLGVARYPLHGNSYHDLLKSSEKAQKHAKKNGKNTAFIFDANPANYQEVSVLEEENRYHKALEMLDNSASAFVVFHKETYETVSENKKARELFCDENNQIDIPTLFCSRDNVAKYVLKAMIALKLKQLAPFPDIPITNNKGQRLTADMEFSYISDDKSHIYLKITPKNNKKISLLKSLIEKVDAAVVVLNKDDELSISYANTKFYETFESTEETFFNSHGNTLQNLLLPERQRELMAQISSAIQTEPSGFLESPLFFSTGESRWFYYDCEKLKTMDSDQKIYCQLTPMRTEDEV